jgi:hypothetical protein
VVIDDPHRKSPFSRPGDGRANAVLNLAVIDGDEEWLEYGDETFRKCD